MATSTEFDESFYEGTQETDEKDKKPRFIAFVVVVYLLTWAYLFLSGTPPTENWMIYVILPSIISLCILVGGTCSTTSVG